VEEGLATLEDFTMKRGGRFRKGHRWGALAWEEDPANRLRLKAPAAAALTGEKSGHVLTQKGEGELFSGQDKSGARSTRSSRQRLQRWFGGFFSGQRRAHASQG